MSIHTNKKTVTIAAVTTICQVAFHVVTTAGGNEIAMPESRDVLEDIANEVKLQLAEKV